MIVKINLAKPLILKDFKRTSNNQIAVFGVYIHKNVVWELIKFLKNKYFSNFKWG